MISKIIWIGLAFTLLAIISIVQSNTKLEITLSARELPSMDIFDGAPDPFAVVYYSYSPDTQYIKIGQTIYFDNVRECNWTEIFTFDYISIGSQQRLKIDVMDYDYDENDQIGYVEFYLKEVVNTFGNIIQKNISGFTNQGILKIVGKINGTVVLDNQKTDTVANSFKVQELVPLVIPMMH